MNSWTSIASQNRAMASAQHRINALNASAYYGCWDRLVPGGRTLPEYVRTALGAEAEKIDMEAVIEDFHAEINRALPEGVTLSGEHFFGPALDRPEWDGDVLAGVIEAVDFWAIVAKNHHT